VAVPFLVMHARGIGAAKFDVGFVAAECGLYATATLAWPMGFIRSIYPAGTAYAERPLKAFDLKRSKRSKARIT